MTDKQLRKLSRAELVDIIFELQKNYKQLEDEYKEVREALDRKELIMSKAGSIADAAVQINGVLEAAQAAADQYLQSLKAASEDASKIISDAHDEGKRIVSEANEKAKMMDEAAGQRADSIWTQIQSRTNEMFYPKNMENYC